MLRLYTIFSVCALATVCLAWELWLYPTPNKTLALKALPLLPALIGLIQNKLYTHRWLSLLVWAYVLEGTMRAYNDPSPSNLLAYFELLLAVMIFIGNVLSVRAHVATQKLALSAHPPLMHPDAH